MIRTININTIIEDRELQIRDELNKLTIAQYAECLEQLPPVIVYPTERKGKSLYLLADGYHRLAAHRQRGVDEILVEIRQGTEADARLHSLVANCKHGLPLSRTEKRRAIERMLKAVPERADRWIASDLGVDHKTVTSTRERLESGSEIPNLESLLGANGQWYERNHKPNINGNGSTLELHGEIPHVIQEQDPIPPPDPWQDKVIHADCLEWLAADETMYDLIFTDPPYGILDEEWEPANLLDFTRQWLKVALPRLKPTGRLYICFSQRYMFDLKPLIDELSGTSLTYGGVVIWNYRNVFNKKYSPMTYKPTFEPVFYWYGPEAESLRYDTEWNEERGDVWNLATPQSNYTDKKTHPAQKPLELVKGIIRTSTKFEDYILDLFAGSGTTAVAAQELGRRWRVIEQGEEYINQIRERLKIFEK